MGLKSIVKRLIGRNPDPAPPVAEAPAVQPVGSVDIFEIQNNILNVA
mgnify:CR=1 FL=1